MKPAGKNRWLAGGLADKFFSIFIPRTRRMNKRLVHSTILCVITTAVALGAGELVLRMKNSTMKNYDVEMWRYAKELKVSSPDPDLGLEHVKNASARLQSVEIRLNEWGL